MAVKQKILIEERMNIFDRFVVPIIIIALIVLLAGILRWKLGG